MLSQVQYTQLPSYQLGLEIGQSQGRSEGRSEGQTGLLSLLLTHRFGPLDADTQARLTQATPEQITWWAEKILDASTLEDVFKRH